MTLQTFSAVIIHFSIFVCCVDLIFLMRFESSLEQKYLSNLVYALLANLVGCHFCFVSEVENLIIVGTKFQFVSLFFIYMVAVQLVFRVYSIKIPRIPVFFVNIWTVFLIFVIIFSSGSSVLPIKNWLFKVFETSYISEKDFYRVRFEAGWVLLALKFTFLGLFLLIVGAVSTKMLRRKIKGLKVAGLRSLLQISLTVILPLGILTVEIFFSTKIGFIIFYITGVASLTYSTYKTAIGDYRTIEDIGYRELENFVDTPMFVVDIDLNVRNTNFAGEELFPEYKKLSRTAINFLPANKVLQDCVTPPLDSDLPANFVSVEDRMYAFEVKRVARKKMVYGFVIKLTDVTKQQDLYSQLKQAQIEVKRTLDKHKDDLQIIRGRIVSGLIQMSLFFDRSSGEHMRRVSNYTYVIAKELQKTGKFSDILTDEYIDILTQAAPIHDIGKFKVPKEIKNNKNGLTQDELKKMQDHVRYGVDIVDLFIPRNIGDPFFKIACEVALYHHECWDGTGYPEGLKGSRIPLSARIVAVADVFDTISSSQAMQGRVSLTKAFSTVISYTCTQFDPDVVDAFRCVRFQIIDLYNQFSGRRN